MYKMIAEMVRTRQVLAGCCYRGNRNSIEELMPLHETRDVHIGYQYPEQLRIKEDLIVPSLIPSPHILLCNFIYPLRLPLPFYLNLILSL